MEWVRSEEGWGGKRGSGGLERVGGGVRGTWEGRGSGVLRGKGDQLGLHMKSGSGGLGGRGIRGRRGKGCIVIPNLAS